MKGVLKKLVSGKKLARKMLFFPIYLYLAYHKYIYIYIVFGIYGIGQIQLDIKSISKTRSCQIQGKPKTKIDLMEKARGY